MVGDQFVTSHCTKTAKIAKSLKLIGIQANNFVEGSDLSMVTVFMMWTHFNMFIPR